MRSSSITNSPSAIFALIRWMTFCASRLSVPIFFHFGGPDGERPPTKIRPSHAVLRPLPLPRSLRNRDIARRIRSATDVPRLSASFRSASMSLFSKSTVIRSGSWTTRGRPAPGRAPPQPDRLPAATSGLSGTAFDRSILFREITKNLIRQGIRPVLGRYPFGKPLVQLGARDQHHAVEAEMGKPLVPHPIPQ